jgi:hypothetical protein
VRGSKNEITNSANMESLGGRIYFAVDYNRDIRRHVVVVRGHLGPIQESP